MRSLSSLISFIAGMFLPPLAQAVAERHALVEHEALAAPAASLLRDLLEILQNPALEVVDLGKAARQQVCARLLTADAAGAEHRDPAMLCRIEIPRGEILELAKTPDAGIERAFEGAHRHLEVVAGVEQQRVGRLDQRVPFGGRDVDADLPRR